MLRTRLFDIADERGVRYTWLAAKLGYSKEFLSRVKGGTRAITPEFQRRVCELFPDIAPNTLFFDDTVGELQQSLNEVAAVEA